jgi:hypothetical protein
MGETIGCLFALQQRHAADKDTFLVEGDTAAVAARRKRKGTGSRHRKHAIRLLNQIYLDQQNRL